ncbi:MAG: aminopeptidase P family protein [Chloroflexi bacterium]|nr:aminopeptidase P family protein [Chloroflexota bacterium]MBI4267554.1 aminopeptidase P family protein [Chloroflexota bacterium]
MEYEYTPQPELLSRIARFQELLQRNACPGAIISQNADLFYFAGTIQTSFLFVPSEGEPVLAALENIDRAAKESKLSRIIPLNDNHQLSRTLSELNYVVRGRIGLELDVLPVNYYFTLCRDFPEADFVDISPLIRGLRAVKSQYEIAQIKKACQILNTVMAEAQKSIRVGMTELEVDGNLGRLARQMGHQGRLRMRGYNQEMFYGHVYCGKMAAIPSFLKAPLGGLGTTPAIAQGASFNTIAEGEPLVIDFGVGINGYVTDITRTFVIGKLPEELLKAYSCAKEVKDFMENWVRPGKRCASLYAEAVRLAHHRGYQDYFMGYKGRQMPFVGHGIGLEIDELPVIGPRSNLEFQAGMVFAFEPKLVFPGVGAIGVEDDYLVTETGVERLTTYDDQILTINGE